MKILIVDDEVVSRTKLTLIMEQFGECETVDNGKDAIIMFYKALLKNDPFDLIMLDINLPEIDGIQVLSEFREAEKYLKIQQDREAKILMVTSYRDKDWIVASAQSGCSDYIAKPFDMATIRKKLDKLGITQQIENNEEGISEDTESNDAFQIFGDISIDFNIRKINLPSLPKIHAKFQEMITTGALFQQIANLLKKDVAISVQLIRMSNSAYYRGLMENKSLEQAVSRLGFAVTEQLVSEGSKRSLSSIRNKTYRCLMENVLKHSIASAYASETASRLLKLELSVDPFTLGLLHDIGKLALLQIVCNREQKGKFDDDDDTDTLVDMLAEYHGPFGARLLEKWKYDEIYIQGAMQHDGLNEVEQPSNELLIVHFANLVAKSIGYELQPDPCSEVDLDKVESVDRLKLDPAFISKTKEAVVNQMEATLELF